MKRLCIGITLILGVLGSSGTALADGTSNASCVGQLASATATAAPGFGQTVVAPEARQSAGAVGEFVSGLAAASRTDCPATP